MKIVVSERSVTRKEFNGLRHIVLFKYSGALRDIAKIIVAGLDSKAELIPPRINRGHPDPISFVRDAAARPTCDLIQNRRYWGGLDSGGTYGFGIFSEEGEIGYELKLTAGDARKIVAGKSLDVEVDAILRQALVLQPAGN